MKFTIINIILIFCLNSYSQTKITSEDLQIIIGTWEGSLTYLDYQTNKPFTMPANLVVRQGKNENILLLNNIYPNEPKANSFDKIKILKKGMMLNKSTVTSRKELENGHIQIQTEHYAKDYNKKALLRYTYTIGNRFFSIKKEVQFNTAEDWIKRSEFKYHRKK